MGVRAVAVGSTVLVLLAGGAVVVDRVAVGRAEALAVRELAANVDGLVGEPRVTIGGFPFLTQLSAGTLSDVSVRADGLTLEGVEVTDVEVDASDVTTAEPYTVARAVLTGTLSAATLQELVATRSDVELELQIEGDQLTAATQLLGLDVTATLVPRVEDGQIRVDVVSVAFGGLAVDVDDLPGVLAGQLSDLTVPIDGLPDGFELSGVVVRDGGVRVTATGLDVELPAGAAGLAP
ncbi:LmeA family phospholipid-binding protein [Pengzhenrongella frigida]|uniref:DUF2993 domain-containing protein n=1 Tax=Pengzhenrongella frigida TaxID=1259133 RepID=A0A4V1ZHF6_9MICO|nr:DUF2993 domain-containing protein [Cellulomonas sp. HLT2-17]RYV51874.1 DUF2993 domain-containing protein [Cellulomonas sp. HLT2-17]